MQTNIAFLELEYGKLKYLDIHGLTKEEAKAELIYNIEKLDLDVKGLVVTHGYHHGKVLKEFIRKEFLHRNVYRIINIDAGRTLLLLNFE